MLLLMIAPAVRAAEGVIEINQAVVEQAGGFPFTINTAGSYHFTGNVAASAGADGIDVAANGVTIDLNGFVLSGGAVGINGASAAQVTVRNGTVTAMSGNGIHLGAGSIVQGVHVTGNGATGILVGSGSLVSNNTVSGNDGGISVAGNGATILQNSITSNSGIGLQISDQSTGYGGNVMFGNDGNSGIGTYTGQEVGGTQISQNLCNGNVCP